MKFNKYLICALFLVLICCIGAASAAETVDDAVAANDTIDEEVTEAADVSDEIDEDSLGVSEEPALSEGGNEETTPDEITIYVGQNTTDDGGNGSKENPFNTFNLACSNIVNGKNVTIKVLDGTYYIDSTLTFDATNLHIQGIGNNVIIKNKYDRTQTQSKTKPHPEYRQCFSSKSLVGNFSLSNVIVDGTNWNRVANQVFTEKTAYMDHYFLIFYNGKDSSNNIKLDNCTFKKYALSLLNDYNASYNIYNCIFDYDYQATTQQPNSHFLVGGDQASFDRSVNFYNCIFNINRFGTHSFSVINSSKCNLIDCWFGQNSLPFYFYIQSGENLGEFCGVTINRYAVFSVYEEKIDDNNYDIIGKLMWNDSTTDGIENLAPMAVTLTSQTGEIPSTATLENGMFKVRYTTTAKEHNITAKLDSEELNLAFNYNVDIATEAKPINYGDDQNITINLPYNASGIIKLTFEDETSEEIQISELSSLNYTIKKALKAGTNKINVSLIDEDSHSYGSTVIDYTISKISDYTLDIDAPTNVTVGDTVEITVTLPEGAKGNVTAFVGKNNFTKEINENIVKINVTGFVEGENEVTINYTGDNKYSEKTIHQFITAKKVETPVNNNTLVEGTQSDSNNPTFTINLPSDATGNLTVTINGKNYTKELVNGSATIVVDNLPAGEYKAIITYSGDDKYNPIIKNTTTIVKEVVKPSDSKTDNNKVTKKAATKITAKKKTFKAKKKVKKYTITLKSGKKPVKKVWVTLKIKGKKLLKAKTNAKGKATFKIKKLTKKGKYNAVIKFKGNKNYKASSKKVKITIKK